MKTYIIFSAFYLPHLGGVERYVYNLAKKLIGKSNKVIIVTSNINSTVSHEIIDGCEVFRLPCIKQLNARFPILKINRMIRYYHDLFIQLNLLSETPEQSPQLTKKIKIDLINKK